MKKTSIRFNEKGLMKETTSVHDNENAKINYSSEFIEEKVKRERGSINFEPPFDYDEVRPAKGNIKFEDPVEPTIEDRLEQLERGQDQIIMTLQTLLGIISKDTE